MPLTISAMVETWPVAGQFIISRGAKDNVDVLVVGISDGQHVGMGEGTPIYYRQENAGRCLGQVMDIAARLAPMEADVARNAVQHMLPAGAARNALDCALWDIEARQKGQPLWQLAGLAQAPGPVVTAFTISLNEPALMEEHARQAVARGYRLLKVKLTGRDDRARVAAVRRGAPDARLIVDANESWAGLDIAAEAEAMARMGVEMIEQPVPHGRDALLAGIRSPIPLIADESCQTLADMELCALHYDGVNIKLDKAGGLTEALRVAADARARGMEVMTGCMLSTSLAVAPAYLLSPVSRWVDLDAPELLAEDREGGFLFREGMMFPPA